MSDAVDKALEWLEGQKERIDAEEEAKDRAVFSEEYIAARKRVDEFHNDVQELLATYQTQVAEFSTSLIRERGTFEVFLGG